MLIFWLSLWPTIAHESSSVGLYESHTKRTMCCRRLRKMLWNLPSPVPPLPWNPPGTLPRLPEWNSYCFSWDIVHHRSGAGSWQPIGRRRSWWPTGAAPASLIPVVAVVFHLRFVRWIFFYFLFLPFESRLLFVTWRCRISVCCRFWSAELLFLIVLFLLISSANAVSTKELARQTNVRYTV